MPDYAEAIWLRSGDVRTNKTPNLIALTWVGHSRATSQSGAQYHLQLALTLGFCAGAQPPLR